jgi:hypothetical protein
MSEESNENMEFTKEARKSSALFICCRQPYERSFFSYIKRKHFVKIGKDSMKFICLKKKKQLGVKYDI